MKKVKENPNTPRSKLWSQFQLVLGKFGDAGWERRFQAFGGSGLRAGLRIAESNFRKIQASICREASPR
jgi:hypothetical protein